MESKRKKVCFAASSGGHFEQLSMLKPLMDKYDSFVVTEETAYKAAIKGKKMYYLHQVNRKEWSMPIWMIVNAFKSMKIVIVVESSFTSSPLRKCHLQPRQGSSFINMLISSMFNGNR